MAQLKWVVRVIVPPDPDPDGPVPPLVPAIEPPWLECLRYAGLVKIHEDAGRQVFDLYPPAGVDSVTWARQNAERMESFGICAAAAPEWRTGEEASC